MEVGETMTLADRLEWVVKQKIVPSYREWSARANLAPSHAATILARVKEERDEPKPGGRERGPTLSSLLALAKAANVSAAWLLLGMEDPFSVTSSNHPRDRGARRMVEDAEEDGQGPAALKFVRSHRPNAPNVAWRSAEWHQWWAAAFREHLATHVKLCGV